MKNAQTDRGLNEEEEKEAGARSSYRRPAISNRYAAACLPGQKILATWTAPDDGIGGSIARGASGTLNFTARATQVGSPSSCALQQNKFWKRCQICRLRISTPSGLRAEIDNLEKTFASPYCRNIDQFRRSGQ